MLNLLVNSKYKLLVLGLHVVIGIISAFTPNLLIVWFYTVLISGLYLFTQTGTTYKDKVLTVLICYLSSLELLTRMAKTTPFIPYEVSKYIMLSLLLLGIFTKPIYRSNGWIMFILLIPAIFYDLSGRSIGYMPIVFNFLGPANVALAIVYFSRVKLTAEDFKTVLFLLISALLSAVLFTVIRTPSYEDIEFTLSANHLTSGGFGSNQVSSAFGVGITILFVSAIQGWKLCGYRWLDVIIMFMFTFQGLISFSRGGVLGGILACLLFLILRQLFGKVSEKAQLLKLSLSILIFGFLFSQTFNYIDQLTQGNLSLRYQGQTSGTVSGTKAQSLNNALSNRPDIFLGDIELWQNHPILGVGVGASRYLREKVNGVIAHIELSRLLAEHGLFGLFYFMLLLKQGFYLVKRARIYPDEIYFVSVALFFLALFTTFHASMRTFITPLLIGLSFISLKYKVKAVN